jgi:hypothetical protein
MEERCGRRWQVSVDVFQLNSEKNEKWEYSPLEWSVPSFFFWQLR